MVLKTGSTIEQLTRDELQGVIAHEFSHIFHGDMKINAKLIGVLFGILFIYEIGSRSLRSTRYRSRSSSKNGGGLVIIMLAFIIVGLIGYFFGSLIKAAISRQREFLADAAAVQYTRNPAGISMALAKIGHFGSAIEETKAGEVSHMFFANGISSFMGLFATHPPLSARINKIGHLRVPKKARKRYFSDLFNQSQTKNFAEATHNEVANEVTSTRSHQAPKSDQGMMPQSTNDDLMDHIGSLSESGINKAKAFISSLPQELMDAIHDPQGMSSLLSAIAISINERHYHQQLDFIKKSQPSEYADRVLKFHSSFKEFGKAALIPVIELACPALRRLGNDQKRNTVSYFIKVLESKQNMELLDYLLIKILETSLDQDYLPRTGKRATNFNFRKAMACVISALAKHGSRDEGVYLKSYLAGVKSLKLGNEYYQQAYPWDLYSFDTSIRILNQLAPKHKKVFIDACAKVASVDGQIVENELIVLRGICDCLGCPSPFF
ncbi:MAG: M48 family metalloprotease [Oligoflexales bacterium]|nr:M48 family metalloprotease [Oligoflexales bacterium]